jgi:hypothetical protein
MWLIYAISSYCKVVVFFISVTILLRIRMELYWYLYRDYNYINARRNYHNSLSVIQILIPIISWKFLKIKRFLYLE